MKQNILLQSFKDFNFKDFKVPLITIYEHPKDHPEHYVARLFDIDAPSPFLVAKKSLEELRNELPPQFQKLERQINDDPVIVEVWV